MVNKYNNQIYKMYVEETKKTDKLTLENKQLKKELKEVKLEFKKANEKIDNFNILIDKVVNAAVDRVTEKYEKKIEELNVVIKNQSEEIDRLRNRINKNSSNSSKPSSTEIISSKKNEDKKTSANQYNYRTKSKKQNGGQPNHKGYNLSIEYIEQLIKDKKVIVKEFIHYIHGNDNDEDTIKYRTGIIINTYVEKHIFKHTLSSTDILPKEFYTDVTYDNNIKSLCVELGAYNVISMNRIVDLISILTNNIIKISEGTIYNFYKEFSQKSIKSLNNIKENLLDYKTMNTDEITTKYNGSNAYFRGYGNKLNVIYMPHTNKGHKPIKEDGIITNYNGIIIGDHDTTLYSYGIDNAECNIHVGRYLEELIQNIYEIYWPCQMKELLFRINNSKKIALQCGMKKMSKYKLEEYRNEYENILEKSSIENKEISSKYYQQKADKLKNRLIKYEHNHLLFINNFDVDFDNNSMERDLRMIRNKTKIAGCFRSIEGAKCFANMMSIIKTSIKRKINPIMSISKIFNNEILFA